MNRLNEILHNAQRRAGALHLPYAGALTPAEAWDVWHLAPGARLVDVRTRAEWDWVGRIPLAVEIEWQFYPGGRLNPDFLQELERRIPRELIVMFICRSGFRSHDAACLTAEAGFESCYNVLDGFEGDVDANGQRGRLGGWRFSGLPWHS